jgi:hypothetical protein
VVTHDELLGALDELVPTLSSREEPFLLDVLVRPTAHFAP